jgi:hypothetical protein
VHRNHIERIGIGDQMPANPVGIDPFEEMHLLLDLLPLTIDPEKSGLASVDQRSGR